MESDNEMKIALREKLAWQVWLAAGGIAILGFVVSVFSAYSIFDQLDADKRLMNQRQTVMGVITDLEYFRGRNGDGYWQSKITLFVPQHGKIEIRDGYFTIPAGLNAGNELKTRYIGTNVEVEYLPDLSVIRASSSYASDRANQLGYRFLFLAIGMLLFLPLAVVWWRPQWATAETSDHVRNTPKSQLGKRRRKQQNNK